MASLEDKLAAATIDNAFVDAAACGDHAGVAELLEDANLAAAAINALDKDGRTAFHYGCLNDDAPLLRLLLADARVDVLAKSPRGDTGLHMAALYAAQEALRLLLADGRVPVDARNNYKETPLHLAAGSGDKGAAKAARILLDAGATLTAVDQWHRGPKDVSHANAENALVEVFAAYLATRPADAEAVAAVSRALAESEKAAQEAAAEQRKAAQQRAKVSVFGQLGAVKLKKSTTTVRTMFTANSGGAPRPAAAAPPSDGRRALSKLVDFPGDREEIARHLADPGVAPGGADAFGLTALHKFASWGKTEFMDLLLPRLDAAAIDRADPAGKTALHWAVEMASVAAVRRLIAAGADTTRQDANGRTPRAILDAAAPSGVIDRLKAALGES